MSSSSFFLIGKKYLVLLRLESKETGHFSTRFDMVICVVKRDEIGTILIKIERRREITYQFCGLSI